MKDGVCYCEYDDKSIDNMLKCIIFYSQMWIV